MGYMVDTRGSKPDLVRNVNGVFERYDPGVPGKWKGSRFLDEFAWGGGDFVWYDDISEQKAREYMAEIDALWEEGKD
jgi:hypothetical protein